MAIIWNLCAAVAILGSKSEPKEIWGLKKIVERCEDEVSAVKVIGSPNGSDNKARSWILMNSEYFRVWKALISLKRHGYWTSKSYNSHKNEKSNNSFKNKPDISSTCLSPKIYFPQTYLRLTASKTHS